jgi:hypothetical protein
VWIIYVYAVYEVYALLIISCNFLVNLGLVRGAISQ